MEIEVDTKNIELLDPQIEAFLQENIFRDLEKGRPNWDMPHTKAVVHYAKEIIRNTPNSGIDPVVLIIAAYAHDWGYSELFEIGKPVQHDEIMTQKEKHMQVGAEKVKELLKNEVFNSLTKNQKEKIEYLVRIHDKLTEIKEIIDFDVRALVEADTLGALNDSMTNHTFDLDSKAKWLKGLKEKRLPLFIHDYAINKAKELIKSYND